MRDNTKKSIEFAKFENDNYSQCCNNKAKKRHALIGVSTFNSYFSIKTTETLFSWAYENFNEFHVFVTDEVSIFNLIALGYSEKEALKKTKQHDRHIYNKIMRSLTNIGFTPENSQKRILLLSQLSKEEKYIEIYQRYLDLFDTNTSFKSDCLKTTQSFFLAKKEVTEDSLHLSVKYLLAELPLWFETSYILDLPSSAMVYKDLPFFFERICYNYNLLSPQQEIIIKCVE